MILQICFFNIGDFFFAFLRLDAVKLYAASLRTLLKVRLIFPILIFIILKNIHLKLFVYNIAFKNICNYVRSGILESSIISLNYFWLNFCNYIILV